MFIWYCHRLVMIRLHDYTSPGTDICHAVDIELDWRLYIQLGSACSLEQAWKQVAWQVCYNSNPGSLPDMGRKEPSD